MIQNGFAKASAIMRRPVYFIVCSKEFVVCRENL